MSCITVVVDSIQKSDSLHIVKFRFASTMLSMMSLDISEDIKVDSTVKLSIKPSYVAIGKGKLGDISYSNQLKAVVDSIKSGKLLSHISLRLEDSTILESVITKESANRLGIKEGDEVTALIKASEVSISELLDI